MARKRRRRPKHLAALDIPYEEYVRLNGGEFCGICKKPRLEGERKLDRDHSHGRGPSSGSPRGLLCRGDNMRMQYWVTIEWLEAALAYLKRHAEEIVLDSSPDSPAEPSD